MSIESGGIAFLEEGGDNTTIQKTSVKSSKHSLQLENLILRDLGVDGFEVLQGKIFLVSNVIFMMFCSLPVLLALKSK